MFTPDIFNQLSAVLQEMVQATGEEMVILPEAALPLPQALIEQNLVERNIEWFLLVVSRPFSGLLWLSTSQATEITFDPEAIAEFLAKLQAHLPSDSPIHQQIEQAYTQLQPNDPKLQSQFSQRMIELLAQPQENETPVTRDRPSSSPPILSTEDTCLLPPEQERVFTHVATQIRRTQELSSLLKNTLREVRAFLQVDRLIIYQFEPNASPLSKTPTFQPTETNPQSTNLVYGQITYEDVANSRISRILNLSEGMQCFIGIPDYKEKYRKGSTQAVHDIQITYTQTPCLLRLLEWAQVQAKLVVPIVVQEDLWGLLIAHQCSAPRNWQDDETRFLRCIAELMAIAIYQTQLYSQLQQQAQTLEQHVIERTQELYDALNAAQSASLTKTEFLAAMSHELRTPLTAIIGMATTLLRLPTNNGQSTDQPRERRLPPEKQQEYLKIIRNSGEHLLELINDILELSQVEAGRTILQVREFSLTQLANETMRILQEKAHQHRIKLVLDLKLTSSPEDTSNSKKDRFVADPRRVKQIILNLLSNAIKFTPENGKVTLRIWTESGKALIQVEDTGIGIPENQFPLLFKKFQQLDTSYRRQYEGTGLGLALTKQLVELHGGKIEVESIVNQGSTFTVCLPAQPLITRRNDPLYCPTNDHSPQFTGGRVVLVESHEATANVICDLLIAAGHQVIWMIDGMTAIQQIEFLQPEVVVFSTQLAGISGSEFLHRLRQKLATATVKVLVLATTPLQDFDSEQSHDPNDFGPEDPMPNNHWLAEGADACLPLTIALTQPEQLLDKVAVLITEV
jgi:two-component system sensor histidine kinase/response regulator